MRLSIPKHGITADVPIWISVDTFLDEELDACPISIENTRIREPFQRFTEAILEIDGEDPTYWMIGSDTVNTGTNGLSQHLIQLIEPTKWLERWMVGSKTVTQPLCVDYLTGTKTFSAVEYRSGENPAILLDAYRYESPRSAETALPIYPPFCFDGIEDTLTMNLNSRYVSVSIDCVIYRPDGEMQDSFSKTYEKQDIAPVPEDWKNTSPIGYASLALGGVFRVSYKIVLTGLVEGVTEYSGTYPIAVVSSTGAKERTLEDAARSMILAADTLNETEAPIFELNADLAAYLRTIKAPEITVTNANLREALDECAKYVGSITRLDLIPTDGGFKYEINFEKYCKDTVADVSELGGVVNVTTRSVSCEDYCTALDATAANVVQYKEGGALSDPSRQFFRTLRSEDASYRVTEGNAQIVTAFPIERIDSLICRIYADRKINDGSGNVSTVRFPYKLELISYLFESTEYGALSSYEKEYPFSKAYALCYTLGQKNITGLDFTVPNPVHSIFSKPALVNIINREMKRSYGEDAPQFNNWDALDFTKLLFRVTYVPTGALRVRMRKPNSYGNPESVLAFNQSAAKLDATAFGRSMFGAALRMGNKVTTYHYAPPIGAHVPEKGERFGEDGYISEVHIEYGRGYKKVTLEVTEGFNRLSQFVGVNKSQRIFEISERLSLDRHVVYEDFCLVGTKDRKGEGALVSDAFLGYVKNAFSASPGKPLGPYLNGRGYDEDDNPLVAFTLPLLCYGMGNAVTFTASFEDNFGAGRRIDGSKRTVNVENDSEGYYATETDVRYTDLFGRIDKMAFAISDGIGLDIYNVTEAQHLALANTLPQQYDEVEEKHTLLASAFDGKRLVIDKDSRECIKSMTYQISFMEADGVKLSPFFAERLPFANVLPRIVLVPLAAPINNLTEFVPVEYGDNDRLNGITVSDNCVKVSARMPRDGVAWAAVDWELSGPKTADGKETKRFLFGANQYAAQYSTVTATLTFFRKGGVSTAIRFTIDGIPYQAANGMTWGEWAGSVYDTTGYTVSGDVVYTMRESPYIEYMISTDGTLMGTVRPSDRITAGYAYRSYEFISGGGGSN